MTSIGFTALIDSKRCKRGEGKHFDSLAKYRRRVAGYNSTIGTFTSGLYGVINRIAAFLKKSVLR